MIIKSLNQLKESKTKILIYYIQFFVGLNLIKSNIKVKTIEDLFDKRVIYLDDTLMSQLLTRFFKKPVTVKINNAEFINEIKKIINSNEFNTTVYPLISPLIKTVNDSNKQQKIKIIKNRKELVKENDQIGSKYKILNLEYEPGGKTLLYINGSLLRDDVTHDTLLDRYSTNYNRQYKKDSIKDLTEIIKKKKYLTWDDLNYYQIEAARLYFYPSGTSELLITYGTNNIKQLAEKIHQKLQKKIYTYLSDENLIERIAKIY